MEFDTALVMVGWFGFAVTFTLWVHLSRRYKAYLREVIWLRSVFVGMAETGLTVPELEARYLKLETELSNRLQGQRIKTPSTALLFVRLNAVARMREVLVSARRKDAMGNPVWLKQLGVEGGEGLCL